MTPLVEQRCYHHASREAVVRCPQCRRFFCRECVTEHAGRMICASCAAARTAVAAHKTSFLPWVIMGCAGFLLAWLMFYYLGVLFARVPSDFFSQP